MYCVNCGAANPDHAQRCTACGRELLGAGGMTPPELPTEKVPTHLVPAILTTLCCGCLPFGIVAIVFASQVSGKLAAGDVAGARQASKSAKRWCWISFAIGVVVFAISMIFNVLAYLSRQR